MVASSKDWTATLERWLEPFLDRLGHAERRRMCPLHGAGLIVPGDRKSVQPMAERFTPGEYDRPHHFIASGAWNSAPLEAELLVQGDRRHRPAQEGHPFGRRGPAIRLHPGQERQLPDAGVGNPRPRRGARGRVPRVWSTGAGHGESGNIRRRQWCGSRSQLHGAVVTAGAVPKAVRVLQRAVTGSDHIARGTRRHRLVLFALFRLPHPSSTSHH